MKTEADNIDDGLRKPFSKIHTKHLLIVCAVLVIAIVAVYFQVLNHPFANIDDKDYVINNPHVSNGISQKSIAWAFTTGHSANWHPVTWISHMMDVQLYGMDPRGHHLTNLILHTISTLLLLFLLSRVTGSLWKSSFVAAMFALHPLHIESVAWVAERKDVLSGLFCFITLLLYFEYVKSGKSALYILALFSFMIGLMSKPMLVTLPVIMLLMDLWPLDRYSQGFSGKGLSLSVVSFSTLAKEKIPFILCSLASSVITYYAQLKGGAVSTLQEITFSHRFENALLSYVKYIFKILWPSDLAVYYPLPTLFSLWQVIASLLFLIIITVSVLRIRNKYPYVVVGWAWYLLTLIPVIGIIQVGNQAMADRYTYIPSIGLFIMLAWGVPDLLKRIRHGKIVIMILAGFAIFASSLITWQQLDYWRDDITLFRHDLQVTTGNWSIHNALGLSLADKGDKDAAIAEFKESIRIYPNSADTHINLGMLLAQKGNFDEAIAEFRTALLIDPKNAEGHKYLGSALSITGHADGAIQEFHKAVEFGPDLEDAHYRLGQVLAETGDINAAVREYKTALQINPGNTHLHNALGIALARSGNVNAAIQEFKNSLSINPNDAATHNNLGFALAGAGDTDAAIQEYQLAQRLNPDDIQIRNNIEAAISKKTGGRRLSQ